MIQIMYAIAFDLDTAKLKKKFGANFTNKYAELNKFMAANSFKRQQESLYYGDKKKTTLGTPFLVARELSKKFPWFKECVKDIRILQILDADDLKPHL